MTRQDILYFFSGRSRRWDIHTNILKFNSTAFYSSTGENKKQQNKTQHKKGDENRCWSYSTGKGECFNIEKFCRFTP